VKVSGWDWLTAAVTIHAKKGKAQLRKSQGWEGLLAGNLAMVPN